jgi:hypothetical protein
MLVEPISHNMRFRRFVDVLMTGTMCDHLTFDENHNPLLAGLKTVSFFYLIR